MFYFAVADKSALKQVFCKLSCVHDPSHPLARLFLPSPPPPSSCPAPAPGCCGSKGQASRRRAENRPVRPLRRTRPAAQKITLRLSPPPRRLRSLCPDAQKAWSAPRRSRIGWTRPRAASTPRSPAASTATYALEIARRATPAPAISARWSGRWSKFWPVAGSFRRGLSPERFCVSLWRNRRRPDADRQRLFPRPEFPPGSERQMSRRTQKQDLPAPNSPAWSRHRAKGARHVLQTIRPRRRRAPRKRPASSAWRRRARRAQVESFSEVVESVTRRQI